LVASGAKWGGNGYEIRIPANESSRNSLHVRAKHAFLNWAFAKLMQDVPVIADSDGAVAGI
jgi:hypothetical protein